LPTAERDGHQHAGYRSRPNHAVAAIAAHASPIQNADHFGLGSTPHWRRVLGSTERLWVVNDSYQTYTGCKVQLTIRNDTGNVLSEQSCEVDKIAADSSAPFAKVNWEIAQGGY
jgi:hypothetical protein